MEIHGVIGQLLAQVRSFHLAIMHASATAKELLDRHDYGDFQSLGVSVAPLLDVASLRRQVDEALQMVRRLGREVQFSDTAQRQAIDAIASAKSLGGDLAVFVLAHHVFDAIERVAAQAQLAAGSSQYGDAERNCSLIKNICDAGLNSDAHVAGSGFTIYEMGRFTASAHAASLAVSLMKAGLAEEGLQLFERYGSFCPAVAGDAVGLALNEAIKEKTKKEAARQRIEVFNSLPTKVQKRLLRLMQPALREHRDLIERFPAEASTILIVIEDLEPHARLVSAYRTAATCGKGSAGVRGDLADAVVESLARLEVGHQMPHLDGLA